MRFILASGSPRRRELFRIICPDFEVITSDADESSIPFSVPSEYCERLAELKCVSVAGSNTDACVIGADTIVCVDGKILGKPADREDAARMLRLLSGRSHHVLTGLCICVEGHVIRRSFCDTEVTFKDLSDREIDEYIGSGDPFDKAGAYGIQNGAARFCRSIKGDFFNVVGLPVNMLYEMLLDASLL
ncbi:MAG: septum formation protein Maf [Oscillospiraceae bacterium]|nr:septum formation protein Maf [Oscillospiraceae bacterium]